MIVYHGSIITVDKPDVNHSYRPLDDKPDVNHSYRSLDFGSGFL